jgi:hypothetical protein
MKALAVVFLVLVKSRLKHIAKLWRGGGQVGVGQRLWVSVFTAPCVLTPPRTQLDWVSFVADYTIAVRGPRPRSELRAHQI